MDQISVRPSLSDSAGCPQCGSNRISSETVTENFQYGDKEGAVMLSATIPVQNCQSCGGSFTNEDAEDIRHEAVCRYLGVLTPQEVRGVRERYGLSQSDFSELSKIGKASLARWEGGTLIQNQANDNLLYLLMFGDNESRLRDRSKVKPSGNSKLATNVIPFRPRFRSIADTELPLLTLKAKMFDLYPQVMAR